MKDALRAIASSGIFIGISHCLMQQRRAVRGTVREELANTACDEEPATKSRASVSHQSRRRDQGDGAEHGRPSIVLNGPRTFRQSLSRHLDPD